MSCNRLRATLLEQQWLPKCFEGLRGHNSRDGEREEDTGGPDPAPSLEGGVARGAVQGSQKNLQRKDDKSALRPKGQEDSLDILAGCELTQRVTILVTFFRGFFAGLRRRPKGGVPSGIVYRRQRVRSAERTLRVPRQRRSAYRVCPRPTK
ncbi:hypothetical protein Micbo1qcDRAFT_177595 [Microdochium bolleyi]|uniref:Uncharacterized protein n=1 Tax=Microdochium bolleyi TaxID=196109 RepID=A0A136IW64_9PEZI|nr:hypothetical protein Micbo1qcDRAFT_177595 [Microdochium bolleyi]